MALQPTPGSDLGAAPQAGEGGPGGAESSPSASPLDLLKGIVEGAAAAEKAASKGLDTTKKKVQAKQDNTVWFILAAILLLSRRR